MKNIFILLALLFSATFLGQTNTDHAAIDQKMALIPENITTTTKDIATYINNNFKTDLEKVRAVFYWTAANISYDLENMLTVTYGETIEDRVAKTLKTRKGICMDYAAIFNDVANMVGLNSVKIGGYTKQKGKVDTLSHAWCAVKLDGKWYVFDPTWGAGAVINGKYVKKMNEYFYKVEPSKIISSHIPFDYLWQFSNYPITTVEFFAGKTQIDTTKKFFDFEKEIQKQSSLSEIDKLFESSQRIEQNGVGNKMIVEHLKILKHNLSSYRQAATIDKMKTVATQLNLAIALLNDFSFYKNKQFKPTLPDEEILSMVQKPKEILDQCQNDVYEAGIIGKENVSQVNALKKAIQSNLVAANENIAWVKNYLSKSALMRKAMFIKVGSSGVRSR